jgi:hypothetical protein
MVKTEESAVANEPSCICILLKAYAHRNQVRVSIRLIICALLNWERGSWGSSHVSPRVSIIPGWPAVTVAKREGYIGSREKERSFSYFLTTRTLTGAVHAVLVRACAINSRLISVIHIYVDALFEGGKRGRGKKCWEPKARAKVTK